MKRLLLLLLIFVNTMPLYAQLYETGKNVGIGVSSPLGKLDVAGLTYLRAAPTYGEEHEQLRIGRSDMDIRYHSIYSRHDITQSTNYLKFSLHDGGDKPFTTQITVMTLLGNGFVGIGTELPDSKLAVNGNIRAKEIKLETSNWPDYVFDGDYELMSLEELQAHIAEHGHLPGLKSGEEYEEKGVDIMALNRQLVEKMEEMTLYIMDQQKTLNKQATMISLFHGNIEALIKRLEVLEEGKK